MILYFIKNYSINTLILCNKRYGRRYENIYYRGQTETTQILQVKEIKNKSTY